MLSDHSSTNFGEEHQVRRSAAEAHDDVEPSATAVVGGETRIGSGNCDVIGTLLGREQGSWRRRD
jgi:hypothetical protein